LLSKLATLLLSRLATLLLSRLATLLLSKLVGCNTLSHHWPKPEPAGDASV